MNQHVFQGFSEELQSRTKVGGLLTTVGSKVLGGATNVLAKHAPSMAGHVMNAAQAVGPQRLAKYVGGATLGAGALGAGAVGAKMLGGRQQ